MKRFLVMLGVSALMTVVVGQTPASADSICGPGGSFVGKINAAQGLCAMDDGSLKIIDL